MTRPHTRRPDEHKKHLGGVGAIWLVEQMLWAGPGCHVGLEGRSNQETAGELGVVRQTVARWWEWFRSQLLGV